jgi:hypothetical protein
VYLNAEKCYCFCTLGFTPWNNLLVFHISNTKRKTWDLFLIHLKRRLNSIYNHCYCNIQNIIVQICWIMQEQILKLTFIWITIKNKSHVFLLINTKYMMVRKHLVGSVLLIVLVSVLCFLLCLSLSCVLCTRCCKCLYISWFALRFSLTFISSSFH